jgi:hypothetical protein
MSTPPTNNSTTTPFPTILAATSACRAQLRQCLKIQSLGRLEWAENRLCDFNLWEAGIGESSAGTSALEARLASLRNLVLNLLVMYHSYLETCVDLGMDWCWCAAVGMWTDGIQGPSMMCLTRMI